MFRRMVEAVVGVVVLAGGSLAGVGSVPAGAEPAVVTTACTATGPLTPTGLPLISDVLVQYLTGAELPIPVPLDIERTRETTPGGTVRYDASVSLDVSPVLTQLLDEVIRPLLVDAGYPDLAASLYLVFDMDAVDVRWPYPDGTHGEGPVVVTGEGATSSHGAEDLLMEVDSIHVDSRVESDPISFGATWFVRDEGTVAPGQLGQAPPSIDFTLGLTLGGNATLPPLPFPIPVSGGVTGPNSCEPTSPLPVLVYTDVLACDSGFSDVPEPHPFCLPIDWAAEKGLVNGYADGTFRPSLSVTRQAYAAMLHRDAGSPTVPPGAPTFSDVPETHPFFTEISWLASTGITTGYPDGTFRPGAVISRQAIAAFFHRYDGEPEPPVDAPTFTDVPEGHQFFTEISWFASTGITSGYADGTYRPSDPVTRQATAAFFQRYHAIP
jgi:hypothetical protein